MIFQLLLINKFNMIDWQHKENIIRELNTERHQQAPIMEWNAPDSLDMYVPQNFGRSDIHGKNGYQDFKDADGGVWAIGWPPIGPQSGHCSV